MSKLKGDAKRKRNQMAKELILDKKYRQRVVPNKKKAYARKKVAPHLLEALSPEEQEQLIEGVYEEDDTNGI